MMRNWFWLLVSGLAWASAAAAVPPQRVEITYEIVRNGITIAEVLYQLQHDGRSYQISETSKGRGILALRGTMHRASRGLVTADGLKPLEFVDERTGRSNARATFDRELNTVTLQYKGEPRVEPLPAQANDRLAFLFDFAFAPPGRPEVAFDLFDGRGQSRHVYSLGGPQRVSTPLGEFDALRYVRGPEDDRTEIWFASEFGYLPVRILVVEKNGTRYDQMATKISTQ